MLPVALLLRVKWPQRTRLARGRALGIAFFGLFFVLYNIAVSYTTAARASLALSTLPLQTMMVGALLGIEPLTARKTARRRHRDARRRAALATGLAARRPAHGAAN